MTRKKRTRTRRGYLVKIEAKLKSGLPDDTAPEAEHKKPGGG
jgi:hypothetical protein